MGDLSDKVSDWYMNMMMKLKRSSPGSESSDGGSESIKTCADCGTTKTPLWRGGPAGPKSLCNACGIRSRKRRRALLGMTKEEKKAKKAATTAAATTSGGDSQNSSPNSGLTSGNTNSFCLKKRLLALGSDVVLQRPRSRITKRRRKLGEVEQAAFLLMALSCGFVFA
ncbi:GATA transcription factor 15-like isoform X2 [Bidens hawaiensis]|uniref:GATA transcription factor 15-like isoform X2 n=1 Tax=Bidens hawaiensis TaxID=980011 RepID=UPI00404A50F1